MNAVVAKAYFDTYTPAELMEIRAACLATHAGGGRRHVAVEGGSVTVDAENCESILETVMEAIRMHEAEAENACAELSRPPVSWGIDFRNKQIT